MLKCNIIEVHHEEYALPALYTSDNGSLLLFDTDTLGTDLCVGQNGNGSVLGRYYSGIVYL